MYEELKKMINEIIDMNGGEFLYSPRLSFYQDGRTILSTYIVDTATNNAATAQDFRGDIMQKIHDITEKMIEEREGVIAKRKEMLMSEIRGYEK